MDPRLHIKRTPSCGNGVFAEAPIPPNTLLLTTPAPYLSVINHVYRKEACGYCFKYNLGRRWKIRSVVEAGFVFCSEKCRLEWEVDVGVLGMKAYACVEELVRNLPRAQLASTEDQEPPEPLPTEEDVLNVWAATTLTTARILALRVLDKDLNISSKLGKNNRKLTAAIFASGSPDTLSFLLSGVLALHKSRDVTGTPELASSLKVLYSAPVPYTSLHALQSHVTTYLQLLSILPFPLLDLVTPTNLRRITGLAYDNAFGIRSVDNAVTEGIEDPGSELLGYALYPVASIFNHSCAPNVRKAREGRVWRFWSIGEIGVGEEACITYLGGDERSLGTKERRERLRGGWEFECTCLSCGCEKGV